MRIDREFRNLAYGWRKRSSNAAMRQPECRALKERICGECHVALHIGVSVQGVGS
jgi:hypothetical protein